MKKTAKQVVRASARAAASVATKLGGRSTAASGAWLEKGDARVPGRFRIETKCPPTRSYRLTFSDWEKIREAALQANEVPVFHLKLGHEEIAVIREQDYLGFGGTVTGPAVATLGPPQAGHTLTDQSWARVLAHWQHGSAVITNGERQYQLRFLPLTEFVALVKEV